MTDQVLANLPKEFHDFYAFHCEAEVIHRQVPKLTKLAPSALRRSQDAVKLCRSLAAHRKVLRELIHCSYAARRNAERVLEGGSDA